MIFWNKSRNINYYFAFNYYYRVRYIITITSCYQFLIAINGN